MLNDFFILQLYSQYYRMSRYKIKFLSIYFTRNFIMPLKNALFWRHPTLKPKPRQGAVRQYSNPSGFYFCLG